MSSSQSDPHQEAGDLLQPMLDLFGGADGGPAFARLRHSFLPDMLKTQDDNMTAAEFILMVRRFSKLCQIMLDQK